jgi:hypothetical protein
MWLLVHTYDSVRYVYVCVCMYVRMYVPHTGTPRQPSHASASHLCMDVYMHTYVHIWHTYKS